MGTWSVPGVDDESDVDIWEALCIKGPLIGDTVTITHAKATKLT